MELLSNPVKPLSKTALKLAQDRQQQLTKPPGSLGQLEKLAIKLAAMQACECPSCDTVEITVFAADHGISAEGVSAFPAAVTVQMIENFARGGAAISVLAKSLNAPLSVINLGTFSEVPDLPGVSNHCIAAGTANFLEQPAMSQNQLSEALNLGANAISSAREAGAQLWIGGEMGIANTSSASAVASALLNIDPMELVGPGTGLDANGVTHKIAVIREALKRPELSTAGTERALDCLREFGGFEIAALSGAYLAAAQQGITALVDGFICTVAALVAERLQPGTRDWLLFAHQSQEPGHRLVLNELQAQPLLDLELRLGEASGAATAVPLLRLACELHKGMATFADAGVSQATE